jgi:methylase of polypeptide subunit release factors
MKIEQNILQILSESSTEGNHLTLVGTLDRKTYQKVNQVLEACGGKWNKKSKTHVFSGNALERIEQIILTGEVEIPKNDFDYFPTPPNVVEILLNLSEITSDMTVLEPSVGQGAIAIPCAKLSKNVVCYEISEKNLEEFQKNIQNSELTNLEVSLKDFLEVIPEKKFDRIVMNPPFGNQMDIKHINHAVKFLKDGGRIISVMSSAVLWRDNKLTKDFRNFVESNKGTFTNLPESSFKASGTLVNTVVLKMEI